MPCTAGAARPLPRAGEGGDFPQELRGGGCPLCQQYSFYRRDRYRRRPGHSRAVSGYPGTSRYLFHDTEPSGIINHARHAVPYKSPGLAELVGRVGWGGVEFVANNLSSFS